MNTNDFLRMVNFANENTPKPTETNKYAESTFVGFGDDNLFPLKLLRLFNQSPTHGSLVKQKASYIIGAGLQVNNKKLDVMVNPNDSLDSFVKKCVIDYLVHGYYTVKVTFNVFKQPLEFYHVPAHQARWNNPKSDFWVVEDWTYRRNTTLYDRYDVGYNQDSTSKLYLFCDYNSSDNIVYPVPEYYNILNVIQTDIALLDFTLNQVKNHFSPSSIITVANGSNVEDAEKMRIMDDIEENFKGEKGAKFMIEFINDTQKPTQVQQLGANDWTGALLQTYQQTMDTILKGHSINNGMLFGHAQAGKLGSSNELAQAYHQFKVNYCEGKRNELEASFNKLFTGFEEISGKLEFVDKSPVTLDIKPETIEKCFTVNEMRAINNMPPRADGDRLIGDLQSSTPEPTVAPVAQAEQPDEKKKSSGEPVGRKLTEEDFDKVSHLGKSIEEFDILDDAITHFAAYNFNQESDIAEYLIDNDIKGLTLSELIQVMKEEAGITVTKKELDNVFKNLMDSKLADIEIDAETKRIKVTPLPKPNVPKANKVTVMYKYIKKPEVSGGDLIKNSRSFCVKLIENNRLYTRSEIQEMSSIFGYDIYAFAGGWYFDPVEEKKTPSCRHKWQPIQVIRKNQE